MHQVEVVSVWTVTTRSILILDALARALTIYNDHRLIITLGTFLTIFALGTASTARLAHLIVEVVKFTLHTLFLNDFRLIINHHRLSQNSLASLLSKFHFMADLPHLN